MNKKEFLESGLVASAVEEATSFLPARIDKERKSLFHKLLMKLCGVCFDFGKREGTEGWQYPDFSSWEYGLLFFSILINTGLRIETIFSMDEEKKNLKKKEITDGKQEVFHDE